MTGRAPYRCSSFRLIFVCHRSTRSSRMGGTAVLGHGSRSNERRDDVTWTWVRFNYDISMGRSHNARLALREQHLRGRFALSSCGAFLRRAGPQQGAFPVLRSSTSILIAIHSRGCEAIPSGLNWNRVLWDQFDSDARHRRTDDVPLQARSWLWMMTSGSSMTVTSRLCKAEADMVMINPFAKT